jgi:hypothetical protein
MPGKLTFDTVLDALVLLIPATVALALVVLLLSRRRSGAKAIEHPTEASKEPLHAISQPAAAEAMTTELLTPNSPESADAIATKIETAISNGATASLSSLYFDLAGAHERAANIAARMSALRSAAGHGALHGPPAAHAAARLALGEAAYQAGDLTSACEQWHLARTAFHESGDTEQHARVEKRMRENGCPTDWVLTDF